MKGHPDVQAKDRKPKKTDINLGILEVKAKKAAVKHKKPVHNCAQVKFIWKNIRVVDDASSQLIDFLFPYLCNFTKLK